MHQTLIRQGLDEVTSRLAELGLSREVLLEAVRASAEARNSTTPHHPKTFPGIYAHAEAVRALRDSARVQGWRAVSHDGLEFLLDETDQHAVLVSTGDEGTGRPEYHVSTKYPRGPRAQDVLESNQLSLIANDRPIVSARKTWLLLIRQIEAQILSEFSLARAIGEDGHIALWTERIMLPPLALGAAPGQPVPDLEPTEAVDIPLPRRG